MFGVRFSPVFQTEIFSCLYSRRFLLDNIQVLSVVYHNFSRCFETHGKRDYLTPFIFILQSLDNLSVYGFILFLTKMQCSSLYLVMFFMVFTMVCTLLVSLIVVTCRMMSSSSHYSIFKIVGKFPILAPELLIALTLFVKYLQQFVFYKFPCNNLYNMLCMFTHDSYMVLCLPATGPCMNHV